MIRLLSLYQFVLSHSVMSDSVTPRTIAHQVPLSMDFSRQEYWSGLPFPPPVGLPNAGITPTTPAASCIGRWSLLSLSHPGSSFISLDTDYFLL